MASNSIKNRQWTTIKAVAISLGLLIIVVFILVLLFYLNVNLAVIIFLVSFIIVCVIPFLVLLHLYEKNRINASHYKSNRIGKYSEHREEIEKAIRKKQLEMISNAKDWNELNHLLVSAQDWSYTSYPEKFDILRKAGLDANNIVIDHRMVLMLTPFGVNYIGISDATKEVCENMGLLFRQTDNDVIQDDILLHIIKLIAEARLLVVNIDNRSPNVFYELGIAHALGKRTILVGSTLTDEHSLNRNQILLYNDMDDYKEKLKRHIEKTLQQPI